MTHQRTLIIEDDPDLRSYYARFFESLREEGFVAIMAESGEKALSILETREVDLVLLDWNLPGISGEMLLKALRTHPKTRSLGIIMITGRGTTLDEIQSLDSGADDHLAKPFDEKELRARLRSLARRRAQQLQQRQYARYPGFEFDMNGLVVSVDGKRVDLTPKETGLLSIFTHRPNTLHRHAFLWDTNWGYPKEQWERELVTTVSSLKRKLGCRWGARLVGVEGQGYVFELPA